MFLYFQTRGVREKWENMSSRAWSKALSILREAERSGTQRLDTEFKAVFEYS